MKLVKIVVNGKPVIVSDCVEWLKSELYSEIGDGVFLEGEVFIDDDGVDIGLLFSSDYMIDCIMDGDKLSVYRGRDCSSEEGKFVEVKIFEVVREDYLDIYEMDMVE